MLGSGTADADGGSFQVPQVNDHFNQFQQGPAPKKTELVTPTVKEEGGFWDRTAKAISGAWDWTADKLSGLWDWLKGALAKIVEFVVENVKFIVGVAVLLLAGAAYLLPGQPGLTQLRNWGTRLVGVDTSRPYGRLKHVRVSDEALAKVSQLVYSDNISGDDLVEAFGEEGWIVADRTNSLNGLQAYVFVKDSTKEVVIAFRGTQFELRGANDFAADAILAAGFDSFNPQAASAREFVEKTINNPYYKGYQFVLTGHSLGGYLAVDSSAQYKIPAVTFNAAGKNLFPSVNASALLGPEAILGVYGVNMLDPDNRKQTINEGLDNYDDLIRNYNYDHDLVGGVNYRPGETYVIDKQGQVTEDEGLDNGIFDANLDIGSHSISNFTGYDDKTKQQVDTPLLDQYGEDGNIAPR
ncbi:Protein of unknown function [Lihuaxuella thermophila]|uniref:Lipase (Class 3) n=2 Tax=Lihuaxuella thermophila TaxID=1173111 RepID=A0A1H8CIZ3_9BACL|nr:Protein of unknown function [Lihuaxuella thermophila]